MHGKRKRTGELIFVDYPDFTPNLTPRQMFQHGSFGGTYWRPIHSRVTGKSHKNAHKTYPTSWWKGINETTHLTRVWEDYDKEINRYKVRVGTTLEYWEDKAWIHPRHPYGWVQWYCGFFMGRRGPDDRRQIDRWKRTAGPRGRFRRRLINMIRHRRASADDARISPKIRQTLQHWAVEIKRHDIYP